MALQDILAAIIAQADTEIADARAAHQKELTNMREQSERTIAKKKQDIAVSKEQKREQMKAKAQTHASMLKRNAALEKKQELLERTYASVIERLGEMSDKEIEPLMRACIKEISESGTIHPAAKHENLIKKLAPSEQFKMGATIDSVGGFNFVAKKQEHDCTFEYLVQNALRPQTELETSHTLFGTA